MRTQTFVFQTNTEKLLELAQSKEPFHCKDIEIALTEIQKLTQDNLQIKEQNDKLKSRWDFSLGDKVSR